MADIGRRLHAKRTGMDLSALSVGKKLGVSHTTIARWEAGEAEPPIAGLMMLARLYDTTIDFLLTGQGQFTSSTTLPTIRRAHRPLDPTPPAKDVAEAIGKAWSVLESDTSTAVALEMNICEFHEKIFGKEKPQKKENAGGGK